LSNTNKKLAKSYALKTIQTSS